MRIFMRQKYLFMSIYEKSTKEDQFLEEGRERGSSRTLQPVRIHYTSQILFKTVLQTTKVKVFGSEGVKVFICCASSVCPHVRPFQPLNQISRDGSLRPGTLKFKIYPKIPLSPAYKYQVLSFQAYIYLMKEILCFLFL